MTLSSPSQADSPHDAASRHTQRPARVAPGWLPAAILVVLASACGGDPEVRKQQYLENGNRYFDQGKYQEAVIEYRNAVQIDARFAAARVKLGEAFLKLGDVGNATSETVRAADLLPQDVGVQLKAAELLVLTARHDDARARAETALAQDPSNARAHILLGTALAGLKNLEGALAEVEEAIRLAPAEGEGHYYLGVLLIGQGERTRAEASLKRAVELDPKSIVARLALGNLYWTTGRAREAEEWMRSALEIDPRDILANRGMASLCLVTGRASEAEQYFRTMADASPGDAGRFQLVDYYLAVGRVGEAIDVLLPLVGGERKNSAAALRLAQARVASGEQAEADKLVDAVIASEPDNAGALLMKSRLLAAAGKPVEALDRARAAARLAPASAEAQFTLGRLLAVRGDIDGAQRAFNEVLRLNPRAAAARVELSKLHLAAGQSGAAATLAGEAVREKPQDMEAKLALVRSLLASRRLDEAETELAPLLARQPDSATLHALRGLLLALEKDTLGARQAFEQAQRLDPSSIEALSGLIALDLAARNFSEAKSKIDARLADGAGNIGLLMLGGRTYVAIGDVAGAENLYRRAIELDPTSLAAYAQLGRLYLAQRKLDQARQEFDALAARQERPVAALTMAGMILQMQGQIAPARERFERAVSIDANAAVAANNLAWIHAESGENLDLALQLAQTAVAAMPDSPEAADTLGWTYYKRGMGQLAVSAFERCVKLNAQSPVYQYHLGLAYRLAGDAVRARRSLERALTLSATFAGADDARRVLAELARSGS